MILDLIAICALIYLAYISLKVMWNEPSQRRESTVYREE
jgi:hypothetical protein